MSHNVIRNHTNFSRYNNVTCNGETHTIVDWCKRYPKRKLTPTIVYNRMRTGWPDWAAVTVPCSEKYELKQLPSKNPGQSRKTVDDPVEDWVFVRCTSHSGEYRKVIIG